MTHLNLDQITQQKRYISNNKPEDYADTFTDLNNRIAENNNNISVNEAQLQSCNNQIKSIHDEMIQAAPTFVELEIKKVENKHQEALAGYREDLDKATDQVDELEAKSIILHSEIEHSKNVKDLLDKSNICVPEDKSFLYENLEDIRKELVSTNDSLRDQQTVTL